MLEDYAGALAVATEAALVAGAGLREEFYRTGGPVGHGGHCEADLWAERLIREKLLSAFPGWGYRGEETGYRPGSEDESHTWLVDPNDGTSAYLKGMRGSSVSIALLRDHEPVLGVVYAFAAPDSDGDLFTWAEGCGPLRRQGLAVSGSTWPARLSKDDVVIVSQAADANTEANLECVAPARFMAVPSIAYRLALVAAGEGVAAVSLNDPVPWDYAAGHALLRGVGGELVGQDGTPLVYGGRGSTYSRFCFGGSSAIVRALASRPWDSVFARNATGVAYPETPYPVRLEPGQAISDSGVLSRARGALLGQLSGDSLGSLVEFESGSNLRRRYPGGVRLLEDGGAWGTMAGQPTDDSEMALMLGRSLVARGRYDPDHVAQGYWRWHRSRPFDEGATTRRALGSVREEWTAAKDARKGADSKSQSNGSLMRISPLAIFGWRMPFDEVAETAREDSRLTHPNTVCQEACAALVIAIARAIRGGSPEDVYKDTKQWLAAGCREESVGRVVEEAVSKPPADYQKHQGWVLIALQNAFYQLLHAPTFEEGVVATVMAGGDTDTNAAVAGSLLGAAHGYASVPAQWRRMVLSCRPVEKLSPTRHHRPNPYWPSDALELAEKLGAISSSAAS